MKYPVKKRLLPVLLVFMLCASFLSLSVSAYSAPAVSSNINDHFYINAQRWTDPIKSTLSPEGDGFLRVEYIDGSIVVECYDAQLRFVSGKTLPPELPIYGGVYLCDDYNFVVTGQENYEENDDAEVFRITRYSKDWVRQDSASIFGANTTVPFDAGCVRFDRSGDILYIRTSHEMYTSSDGYNHQANVMISVRISDMTVTDQLTKVLNKNYGYISHSFNQFVRVDGTDLLAVDHGDAYPRSVVLTKYNAPAGQETFYGRVSNVNALPIINSTYHYNDTGVSVGGFEYSDTNYLIAGCSYHQLESTDLMTAHRNIFVTATPKDNFTDEGTTIHWLTDYDAEDDVTVSPPHMVKLEANRFLLIWTENDVLKYCFLNGKGELDGKIITGEGDLSDCVPVLDGHRVIWYVTNYSAPVFYEIQVSQPHIHSYTCSVTTAPTCTEDGSALYTCACGDSYTEILPATGHSFAGGQCGSCGTPGGVIGNLDWILQDGVLTLSGNGAMVNFSHKAEMPWYAWADQITAVVVKEGVTALGDYAFYGLPALKTVSVPEGVTYIGAYAFKNCTALTAVNLPEGLTKLGESAFYGCTALPAVEIPASLWTVQPYTFKNCTGLKTVTFHEGNLQKISDGAFYNTGLTRLDLPDCLDILDVYTFKNCSDLAAVTLGAGLTEIREAAFYATALTELEVPEGIRKVGPYAFKNCTALTNMSLPATLTSIGQAAFYGSRITALSIPDAVTAIGSYAFKNCTNLDELKLPAGLESISEACFYNCSSLERFVLPAKVVTIGDYAFKGCTALLAMERDGGSSKLESVGTSAFQGCTGLLSFVANRGFTTIGDYAFKGCTSLSTVTLCGTEKSLGESAFYGCTALNSITICEGTEIIGDYCFAGCTGLDRIQFHCDAPTIAPHAFVRVTAEAHYSPVTYQGWTGDVLKNYGGALNWVNDEA